VSLLKRIEKGQVSGGGTGDKPAGGSPGAGGKPEGGSGSGLRADLRLYPRRTESNNGCIVNLVNNLQPG